MTSIRGATPAALCASVVVLAVAGCGGESGVEPAGKPKAATPTAEARRQLAEPRSAASTVLRFWESIQNGALPLSLSLYEPRVVSAVGMATFAGMLNEQRAAVEAVRLNILRVEEVAGGRLVGVETLPKVGVKARHSFFLRRVRGDGPARWRIAYDTMSAAGIPSYVQSQTQRSVDPAAAPGRKAVAAGDRAAEAYRRAALAAEPARRGGDGQPSS